MSRCVAAVVVVSAVAGCGDAITLEIVSDRPIPTAIDSVCIGIADTAVDGGHFGKSYRLEDALATLPQTLRVEAGGADAAYAWVRADRGGVAALYASTPIDFGDNVTLSLPKCPVGPDATIVTRGPPVGAASAMLAGSYGQGGTLIVAVTEGAAQVLDARFDRLYDATAPQPPPGTPIAVLAADLDSDCDDDIIIATSAAPPTLWMREGATFVPGNSIGTAPVAAVAAADVDRDGLIDVVVGGGNTLQLWRNAGAGNFTHLASALSAGTRATAISALALGDLDGDGNPDLIVGQAGPPLVAWLGGLGTFQPSDAIVPAVPLDVARLVLADADGDYDPDLAVAIKAAPMRLYIDRDGRLEDQSYVRLPTPIPTARAIAFGGWDASCGPEAVVAADAGTQTLRGIESAAFEGTFEAELAVAAATDALMIDIDDDGDLDAIIATIEGAQWLAR